MTQQRPQVSPTYHDSFESIDFVGDAIKFTRPQRLTDQQGWSPYKQDDDTFTDSTAFSRVSSHAHRAFLNLGDFVQSAKRCTILVCFNARESYLILFSVFFFINFLRPGALPFFLITFRLFYHAGVPVARLSMVAELFLYLGSWLPVARAAPSEVWEPSHVFARTQKSYIDSYSRFLISKVVEGLLVHPESVSACDYNISSISR